MLPMHARQQFQVFEMLLEIEMLLSIMILN